MLTSLTFVSGAVIRVKSAKVDPNFVTRAWPTPTCNSCSKKRVAVLTIALWELSSSRRHELANLVSMTVKLATRKTNVSVVKLIRTSLKGAVLKSAHQLR